MYMQEKKNWEKECILLLKNKSKELKWFQVQELTRSHSEQEE